MPVLLPVVKVRQIADPLEDTPWQCIPFGREEIQECIDSQALEPNPVEDDTLDCWPHAARIAYLVENGWTDAIQIDVGIPGMRYVRWPIKDGNHRLAAAIFHGDEQILAMVGGSLEYAMELFGVDCTEPQEDLNAARLPA